MLINGPHSSSAATLAPAGRPGLAARLWRDPVLLGLLVGSGLLLFYQSAIILLHPPWLSASTDWLLAVLAWPEATIPALLSIWLWRARRRGALAWAIASAAMLAYAVSQALWLVFDQFLLPGRVPSPWWADWFYLLQYPLFFLALVCAPGISRLGQPGISRIKVLLDSLLLALTGTALSWYFLLAPIYSRSTEAGLGKAVDLAAPVGDLVLFFGLVLVFTRQRSDHALRMALRLLIAAVIFSMIADSWYAYSNLYGNFQPGGPRDAFMVACYLLVPLAALAQMRLTRHETANAAEGQNKGETSQPEQAQSIVGTLQMLFPFAAALLTSGLIVLRAIQAPSGGMDLLLSLLVSSCLLVLVMVRQGITTLENQQLQREREAARASELAMRETTRRMDAFLGIASHELKTPLTTLKLNLQLAGRRSQRLEPQRALLTPEAATALSMLNEQLAQTEEQMRRLTRLVNELLDTSHIQTARLELHREPADLAAIVCAAVEEQRQAEPERIIHLHLPADGAAPVFADADRIGQAITNYLTNALKYSPAERPVEVGVQMEQQDARVWVRDEGPGLSPAEQEHIWERFHRVPGIAAQSGSRDGLGLGLYISKTILGQHGGQIGVESVPGEGTTFWFTLPLATAEQGAS